MVQLSIRELNHMDTGNQIWLAGKLHTVSDIGRVSRHRHMTLPCPTVMPIRFSVAKCRISSLLGEAVFLISSG